MWILLHVVSYYFKTIIPDKWQPTPTNIQKGTENFTREDAGRRSLEQSKLYLFRQILIHVTTNGIMQLIYYTTTDFLSKYHHIKIPMENYDKLKAHNNCYESTKRDHNEANIWHNELYLCEVDKVILTSKFWANVGMYNGAKGDVLAFIYKDKSGKRNGNITEAIVVQSCELDDNFKPFISEIPQTDTKTVVRAK